MSKQPESKKANPNDPSSMPVPAGGMPQAQPLEAAPAKKGAKPGHFINRKGQEIPEKYRGPASYRLTQDCFFEGQYCVAGSVLSVVDEKPSVTWRRVDDEEKPTAAAEPSKQEGRAADTKLV